MTRPTTHTFCYDKKGRRCTIAIRRDKEYPKSFNLAYAVTAKEDNFSKKIGKRIVYGRLDFLDRTKTFPSGVVYCHDAGYCKHFLLNSFSITEKRIDMMLNKDLAVHHHHNASLIATTVPISVISGCMPTTYDSSVEVPLTIVGNSGNDLDAD